MKNEKDNKSELRELIATRLDDLFANNQAYIETSNRTIGEKVLAYIYQHGFEDIFIYNSFRQEIATQEIIDKLLADGKNVYLPKITNFAKRQMCAIKLEGSSLATNELQPNTFGIAEPRLKNDSRLLDLAELTDAQKGILAIIPSLYVDNLGHRLGYGGGYYDRYLRELEISGIKTTKVCLVRLEQVYGLPPITASSYDIIMDLVIDDNSTLSRALLCSLAFGQHSHNQQLHD